MLRFSIWNTQTSKSWVIYKATLVMENRCKSCLLSIHSKRANGPHVGPRNPPVSQYATTMTWGWGPPEVQLGGNRNEKNTKFLHTKKFLVPGISSFVGMRHIPSPTWLNHFNQICFTKLLDIRPHSKDVTWLRKFYCLFLWLEGCKKVTTYVVNVSFFRTIFETMKFQSSTWNSNEFHEN